jgi:hypothetical protein
MGDQRQLTGKGIPKMKTDLFSGHNTATAEYRVTFAGVYPNLTVVRQSADEIVTPLCNARRSTICIR